MKDQFSTTQHSEKISSAIIPDKHTSHLLYATEVECQILAAIAKFTRRHNYGPSIKQIAGFCGQGCERRVRGHMKRLYVLGLVTRPSTELPGFQVNYSSSFIQKNNMTMGYDWSVMGEDYETCIHR